MVKMLIILINFIWTTWIDMCLSYGQQFDIELSKQKRC